MGLMIGTEVWEKWVDLFGKERPGEVLRQGLASGEFPEFIPFAEKLRQTQQPPDWHPEGDVLEHTLQTLDTADQIVRREGLEPEVAFRIKLGALCHDFGKAEPGITVIRNSKWTSHGHEEAGPVPIRQFLEAIGAPEAMIKVAIGMGLGHFRAVAYYLQAVLSGVKHNAKAFRNFLAEIDPATPQEVLWVTEADQLGCGGRIDARIFQNGEFLPRRWMLEKIAEIQKQG